MPISTSLNNSNTTQSASRFSALVQHNFWMTIVQSL
jgi:hypothetical protein